MNLNMPLVSVVLPTYNRSGFYLERAIQSVINQSYVNWELIIIDNNSSDGTIKSISSFDDKRIKVLTINNNGNIALSRNLGIDNAAGDYIAFLDSDDYWENDKLYECLNQLKKNDFDAICHGEFWNYKDKNIKKVYGPAYNFTVDRLLSRGNCISLSAIVIKKEKIINVGCFSAEEDIITAEDYDLWIKLSKAKLKLQFTKKILGTYQLHNNSESSNIIRNTYAAIKVIENHTKDKIRLNRAISNCWKIAGKLYYKDGSNKNAFKSFIKSLGFNLCDYQLYLYIVISMIPINLYKRF